MPSPTPHDSPGYLHVVNRNCPSLLSDEIEQLVRYLRMSPAQRHEMLNAVVADPRTSGSLIHAMKWLYTA